MHSDLAYSTSYHSNLVLPTSASDLTPLTIEKDSRLAVSVWMRQETKKTQLCHLISDGGPLRQIRYPGGLESEGLTLRSGNILRGRGRSQQTSQMSETQASLESNVTAAQDQSGLSQSESPPVLSPIVTTAEQR